MRLALYKEWMYWKYVIPLLIICSFLVYFVEYGILLPLTFFMTGAIIYQVITERQSKTIELELSLPMSRDEWMTARFLAHFVNLTSFAIAMYGALVVTYNVRAFQELPNPAIMLIWWGITLITMSVVLWLFLRFSTNRAILIFASLYIGSAVIMMAGSKTDSPVLFSTSPSLWNAAVIISVVGLLIYSLSYWMTKRHFRTETIGTKR